MRIQGMHCNSCKALIQMEIEDQLGESISTKISNLEITDPTNQIGELVLNDATDLEIEKIKSVINSIGSYKVL